MDPHDILQVVHDRLGDVLEGDALRALEEAIRQFQAERARFQQYETRFDVAKRPTDWGYEINGLRFKPCEHNGYQLRADLQCKARWEPNRNLPSVQNVVFRMWSLDLKMIYREDWDAARIGDLATEHTGALTERVMLRCHFDLANARQAGPTYHLQVGGHPEDHEFCWYPKEFDLPRLAYHPVDILLLCQAVMANYFPETYRKLRKDPGWHKAVKSTEHYLLSEYFESCVKSINSNETLLDSLWNN